MQAFETVRVDMSATKMPSVRGDSGERRLEGVVVLGAGVCVEASRDGRWWSEGLGVKSEGGLGGGGGLMSWAWVNGGADSATRGLSRSTTNKPLV